MNTTPYSDDIQDGADVPLTVNEFATIINEMINQPSWRLNADKEADYADGNQLDSELLRKQQELGIPPAKENIIGPAIAAVCGYEAKIRKDWRVTPDGDLGGQDVADVINFRLNQAEKRSGADRAMSRAFRPQIAVGIGWVEVTRAPNSLMFPIQCRYVHRNEIWWDMKNSDGCNPSLPTARWLLRRRWVERQRAAQMFPEHKDIITSSVENWFGDLAAADMMEGGHSTGLKAAIDANRAWTKVEDAWYNTENRTVCITEIWYRRWVPTLILKMKGGRAVEYDDQNPVHQAAVMSGNGKLVEELIPRMRQAYWMGPHMLHDSPTPHPHDKFPYVPFFGYTEDMTGIPFGLVRDMLFPQDNLNSSIAKLRWGMSSVRTERTKGAVAMSDHEFRRTIARANADIILDASHMQTPGARFDVKRDFQLNDQQFNLMNDSRAAIGRLGVTTAFQGQTGTATSGIQEQTQVEQSQVSIADLMDNFEEARACVGELMMSMLIADMGEEEQQVVIEGDVINPPRTVVINKPEVDPLTKIPYRSNDIQRTRLKVSLDDVPSSSSFRAQQLNALSEAVKSMPPEMQQVTMPFMLDLMDLPRKKEVVEAIRKATGQQSPEQMREQIKQELMTELKMRELDIKERVGDAQIRKLMAEAVQTGVQAAFSAMQGGAQIAMNPLIAPIADEIMKGAGYQAPNPGGVDPNFPVPAMPAPVQDAAAQALPGVQANTSPAFPPVPQGAEQGMNGIETPTTTDNLGAQA